VDDEEQTIETKNVSEHIKDEELKEFMVEEAKIIVADNVVKTIDNQKADDIISKMKEILEENKIEVPPLIYTMKEVVKLDDDREKLKL
jgi:ABC-type phosphate/phosphonate transport system ATPase subunit